jgi:hypothetical protein
MALAWDCLAGVDAYGMLEHAMDAGLIDGNMASLVGYGVRQ